MKALISAARSAFHKRLLDTILTIDAKGIPSNADKGNRLSVLLAQKMREHIIENVQNESVKEQQSDYTVSKTKAAGQSSGASSNAKS